jgi:acetate kinase
MQNKSTLILVINSGSSSLKFAVFPTDDQTPLISGLAECLGQEDARVTYKKDDAKTTVSLGGAGHDGALEALLGVLDRHGMLSSVVAVGHRVVHGGERFKGPALVDDDVVAAIEALSPLAPLHNPAHVLGMRTALARMPGIPQVAVFDTSFHQTMPPAAYLYALPTRYYEEMGVRRYGFHGTSHAYVAEEAVRLLNLDPEDHGLVIAHLGNGASATAVLNGRSVDTSMGMTPLEGLVMGTRSGDIDPAIVLYLMRRGGLDSDGVDKLLNKQSGMLGLSGLSNDCRILEAAAKEGHAGARTALDVFCHRLARYIGGLAMSLERLDAVVFTGGIGENSATVRGMTLGRLRPLGILEDEAANRATVGGRAGVISKGMAPAALVVNTNEEWMIARETARLAGCDDEGTGSDERTAFAACGA